MKRILFLLVVSAGILFANAAPKDPNRYASLDGKSGETLFNTLSDVTNVGFKTLGYDGLWTAFNQTDVYPQGDPNAGKIWDMYGECTEFKKGRCGNYSSECDCYNREHSIPKSWFGGSTGGIGCDIFHLVPTDGKVNGMRSNYVFGEVKNSEATYKYNGNKLGPNAFPGGDGIAFEPLDEYKGDFARGYMGTMVKWLAKNMNQKEGGDMFTCNYTSAGGYGLTKYSIELLMKWHREDPVSEKEIMRNDGIEATQGNRNPFIDYPYLAEYFWGVKKGEKLTLGQLMPSYDKDFEPGKSNGYREGWVKPTDDEEQDQGVDVINMQNSIRKCWMNGQLYIIIDNRTYNIIGQQL